MSLAYIQTIVTYYIVKCYIFTLPAASEVQSCSQERGTSTENILAESNWKGGMVGSNFFSKLFQTVAPTDLVQ